MRVRGALGVRDTMETMTKTNLSAELCFRIKFSEAVGDISHMLRSCINKADKITACLLKIIIS